MKYIWIFLCLAACTDTDKASLMALGNPGHIECFSGGREIFNGNSTGVIQTVTKSDGWEFKDAKTSKFIRVSGDCVISN